METARDNGHRLFPMAGPRPMPDHGAGAAIICNPAESFQAIEGFGGALTESTAWVLEQLPKSRRDAILAAYFNPDDGLGYTLVRSHINSCDFSLSTWSLDDTPGDTTLSHFTLAPMRRWLLPVLHEAIATPGARIRFLFSPWSPPAWMKTNGSMTHGGELRADCRDTWARFVVKFVEEMKTKEHIPVWALTVQNEPAANQVWESCLYSAAQERDFVRDHLGPALHAAGLDGVHLLVHDHNRDILDERADTILSDPAAAKYVWGSALHWYVSEDFAASSRLHDRFPDKHILFTEGCWEGGVKLGKWDRGERYARNMIGDLRNWVCGWIDWNMVLDSTGGPNHVGNLCDSPVIVDLKTGEVTFQSSFYYIGQFSRFVHPGAVRIGSTAQLGSLESIAFRNPDGSLAIIVFNPSDNPAHFALRVEGSRLDCFIPEHAIQTYVGSVPLAQ